MKPARRARVLLVDDQPDNLKALQAVLAPLELETVTARSGEEALRELLDGDFAVVLLDVQMPGLDGFATAEYIKQRERTRSIPIIFLTAIDKEERHVFRGYSAGAVDYIFKPFEPTVLRSKVAVFVELHTKNLALRESEERFRTAFANAPAGNALVSPEGRWLQVNGSLCELLGYPESELLERSAFEVMHPDDREATRRDLDRMLRGELRSGQAERRFVHSGGGTVSALVNVSLVRDAQGEPLNFICQAVDISQRERAEEERLRRLREQAGRAEAEGVAETVRKLQAVTDAALEHLALDDLLAELLRRVCLMLDADTAMILLVEPGDENVARGARVGPGGEIEHHVSVPIAKDFATPIKRNGGQLLVEDAEAGAVPAPLLPDHGVRSLLAVPLEIQGRVSGLLQVGACAPGRFSEESASLLRLTADRSALAIDRSRLYERERGVAETLQRSLLPERLPQVPGMAMAARYLPGGAEVGGDWYDAISLENGRVGLVMGDVVGHGVAAASLMGTLRSALRAYAVEGHPPAAVLDRLNRLLEGIEQGPMATLAYLVLDLEQSSVRFASAGHPPPLVVSPEGEATFLEQPAMPLGVRSPSKYEEIETTLEGGSWLVLYTDGLVEQRDAAIDVGLERLRAAVTDARGDPDRLCDQILEQVTGDRVVTDDVALLAVRTLKVATERLELELPAEPNALGDFRSILGRWLERAGATRDEKSDLQVACHEACSNAIEHAYRFGNAAVRVTGVVDDGHVSVVVQDSGEWRAPRNEARGRGIPLMEALTDEVEVSPNADGTTVTLRRRLDAPGAGRSAQTA